MSIDAPKRSIDASKLSRRRLVQSAGAAGAVAGLTIFWSSGAAAQDSHASPIASPEAGATPEATPVATRPSAPTNLDAYLRINEDGTVTLLTGKVEYGQGIETGFRQLAAEELSLPFKSVIAIMGQTDKSPWDLGTFGSLSTQLTGPRIRQAGAAMRAWLLELGAEHLGQDVSAVELKDGSVIVSADPAGTVTYAELASGKTDTRELDPNLPLKDPSTFTVIGQSIPRPDVAQKVNGQMKYGIDATAEGMVWGKIVRQTGFGATLADIDFSEAEKVPGFVGSFRDGDFAGIAAERLDQVEVALSKVKATWTPS
ncbi:MAG: molybdopterin cofactor-binding domain-containing protein, partial [Thermomicrobiales bacterium]